MSLLRYQNTSPQHPSVQQDQKAVLERAMLAESVSSCDQAKMLDDSILDVRNRCQVGSHYIQAVTSGQQTFLSTNLNRNAVQVTPVALAWSIGRNPNCAIAIRHRSVSRCHAMIGQYAESSFYLADLGSSNGTWLNRRRLASMERRSLRDGDMIQLGSLNLEFFIAAHNLSARLQQYFTWNYPQQMAKAINLRPTPHEPESL